MKDYSIQYLYKMKPVQCLYPEHEQEIERKRERKRERAVCLQIMQMNLECK